MSAHRLIVLAVGAALVAVGACSSGTGSNASRPDAGVGDGGQGQDADVFGSGGARGGRSGSGGAAGCARFAFVASGTDCSSTGCVSFSCDCPDAFPMSLTKCTPDGCLVNGACNEICAAGLGDALACTDAYTVAPQGTGGSSGTGGSPGAGGSAGAPDAGPGCTVHVPATSAVQLGSVGLSSPKVIADDTGALYVASIVATASAVDVGGGSLPAGGTMVLWKLDAAHQHVWSRRFGGTFDGIEALHFAANGDLLVGGFTSAQTDLGGGAEPVATTPQAFVARYDRDGTFLKRWLAPAPSELPSLANVVETPSGDILLFESFNGSWTIGARTLTSAGEADIAILRFGADGTLLDVKQYGHGRNDLVFDAVGASDGSLYLIGFSYYSVDFGKNPIDLGTNALSWVVRLDDTLSPVWQRLIGSGGTYPRRAFLDGTALVVAGDATGSIYYGDSTTGALPSGHTFVLHIDTAGGGLLRGDPHEQVGFGARVTALNPIPKGGVAIGGYIGAPANFGDGVLAGKKGSYEPFFAEFDGAGKAIYSTFFCTSKLAGGASGAIGGIARDADSSVLVAPFDTDFDVGSSRIAGPFGSVLVDMPAEP